TSGRPLLRGADGWLGRHTVGGSGRLAFGDLHLRVEGVAHDSKKPGLHTGPGFKLMHVSQTLHQRLLHEIVCIVDVSVERAGERTERGDKLHDLGIWGLWRAVSHVTGRCHSEIPLRLERYAGPQVMPHVGGGS